MVEEGPYACLADIQSAEIKRVIGCLEREIFVRAGEESFLAGKGDDILAPHPIAFADTVEFLLETFFLFGQLVLGGEGQRGDACLVGMGSDSIVRNPYSHPVSAFLTFAFTDEVHDPDLIGVAEREGLSFGGVAVFVDESDEPLNGFAGGLTALEGDVDE